MDDVSLRKAKPALAGWLLIYVEYTILVFALRGLSLFLLVTGDIGIMAGEADFRFHFWASLLLELLSLIVLALIIGRSRFARLAAILREAAVPLILALRILLLGPDGEEWLLSLAEAAAGIGWIVYFLRSRRVRRYFDR